MTILKGYLRERERERELWQESLDHEELNKYHNYMSKGSSFLLHKTCKRERERATQHKNAKKRLTSQNMEIL